jgi:eukaryotic-like serine/threonine-protein kinase
MSLAPGTRLGPYEIGSLIGAGGMGEVYRATDTNLKRVVAIKVLPDALVADVERLARFQREAEVLAALNHANIAHIHGLEKSAERIGLVMELVEGPTLADRIAQGPLPISEAIAIAHQIAQGLETAHEQGIIHRDLKPANVKVRDDGTVKVLDFGLAKVADSAVAASSTLSLSPTITTPAMTQAGLILGTAAYMSPEQAKGRDADKRSDVWSFGCVLYEMLTGRRAFDGEDTSDTLASVLKTDPDWTALSPDLPVAIRTLIQRCLMRDRRQRIADMSVVSFVLNEKGVLDASLGMPNATAVMSSRRLWVAVAASVAVTAGLVGLGAWSLTPASPDRAVAKFSLTLPDGHQLPATARMVVAISPDGRYLAYIGGSALYIKGPEEFGAHIIPGAEPDGVLNPVFSPDGRSIAYFSQADRSLKRIAVTGGASATICAPVTNPFGLTWDGNGILVGQGVQGVVRCTPNGGKPEQLVKVAPDELAHGPQLLPGGQWMIFTLAKDADGLERWDKARIVAHSLTSGERRVVIEGGSDARFLSTGHLVYAVGGRLYAVAFDPAQLTIRGEPALVVDGVRRSTGATSGSVQFSIANSGDLLYVPGPARASLDFTLALADRTGTLAPVKLPSGRYVHVRASRDGTRLAVDTDDGKEANVYTYEMAGTRGLNRLTFGGRNLFPVWAPDGQRVAFQSDRDGAPAVFVQQIDGSGVQQLTRPQQGESHIPESWSPDGKYLSYSVLKDAWYTLWTLSLADGKTARFADVESSEPTASVFAPGGGWIAYHSLPRGASPLTTSSGVYVEPFPASPGRRYQAPKVQRDFQPVWSPDGTELLYVGSTAAGQLDAVPVSTKAGVVFGTPTRFPFVLTAGRLSGMTRSFDVVSKDRFVGLIPGGADERAASPNSELRIVLNWHEELKRVVPVD